MLQTCVGCGYTTLHFFPPVRLAVAVPRPDDKTISANVAFFYPFGQFRSIERVINFPTCIDVVILQCMWKRMDIFCDTCDTYVPCMKPKSENVQKKGHHNRFYNLEICHNKLLMCTVCTNYAEIPVDFTFIHVRYV